MHLLCACAHTQGCHVVREQFSGASFFFHHVVPGIELGWSGLVQVPLPTGERGVAIQSQPRQLRETLILTKQKWGVIEASC